MDLDVAIFILPERSFLGGLSLMRMGHLSRFSLKFIFLYSLGINPNSRALLMAATRGEIPSALSTASLSQIVTS